ncbi:MAG: hypothetical protein ISQ13_00345 [Candidatus Margulisbacteria bacterium]|nr:hypothetical protein [Candidatus Margulisiibacteriota bacterium]
MSGITNFSSVALPQCPIGNNNGVLPNQATPPQIGAIGTRINKLIENNDLVGLTQVLTQLKPDQISGALSEKDQQVLNDIMFKGIHLKSIKLIKMALDHGAHSNARHPKTDDRFLDCAFNQIFKFDQPVTSVENMEFLIGVFKLILPYNIECRIIYELKATLFDDIFYRNPKIDIRNIRLLSVQLENVLDALYKSQKLIFKMDPTETMSVRNLNQKYPDKHLFITLFRASNQYFELQRVTAQRIEDKKTPDKILKESLRFLFKVMGNDVVIEMKKLLKFLYSDKENEYWTIKSHLLFSSINVLTELDRNVCFEILSKNDDNTLSLLGSIITNHDQPLLAAIDLKNFVDCTGFSKTIGDAANLALKMNSVMMLRALDLKRFESEPGFNELIARLFFKALEMKSYDCLTYLLSQEFSYGVFKSLKSQLIATDSRLDVDMEKKTFDLLIQQLRPDELDILPPWGGKGKTSLVHLSVNTDKLSDKNIKNICDVLIKSGISIGFEDEQGLRIKSGVSIDFEDEQGLRLTDIVIRLIAQNATIVLLQLGASTKGINEKLKKIAGSKFVELSGSKGSDDNENIKLLVGLIIICVGLYAFCTWLIKACRHKRQPMALGGAPEKQGAPQNKSSATPPKTKPPKTKTKPAGVQTEADKRKKELEQNLKTLEDDLKRNKAAIDEYLSEIKKFEGNKASTNKEKNKLIEEAGNSNSKKIEGLDKKISGFNNKIERLKTSINSLNKACDEIKRKIQEIEGQLRGEPLGGPAQPAQEGPLTTSGNSSAGAAGAGGNLSPGGAEEEASGDLNPGGAGAAGAGGDSSEGGAEEEASGNLSPGGAGAAGAGGVSSEGGAEEEASGGLNPGGAGAAGAGGDSSEGGAEEEASGGLNPGGAGAAGAGGDSSEGGAVVDASGDQTKMKSDNLGDLRLILNQIVQRRKLTDGSESQSVHGQLNEFQQLILRLSPTKTDLYEFEQQLIKHQPMLIEYFEIYLEEKKRDIEHSVTLTMLAKAWVHFRQDELALRIIMQGVDTSEGLSKMSLEQLQGTLVSGGYEELGQHHIGGMLKCCFELAKSDDQDTFKSALNAWSVLVDHGNWNPIWLKAKDLIYALNEHLMLNPDHAHASGKSVQDLWRLDQMISQLFLIDGLSMDALEQLYRRAWNLDGPMQPAVFFTEEVVVSDLHQYVFQIINYCKDHAGAPIANRLRADMNRILQDNSIAYLSYVAQGHEQAFEIERELDLKVGEILSDKDPMAFLAEQRPTDQQELLTTLFTVPDGVDPAKEVWTSFNNMQSEFLRYIQG